MSSISTEAQQSNLILLTTLAYVQVYENYNKFISATDTIRKMKQNVESMESEMTSLQVRSEYYGTIRICSIGLSSLRCAETTGLYGEDQWSLRTHQCEPG